MPWLTAMNARAAVYLNSYILHFSSPLQLFPATLPRVLNVQEKVVHSGGTVLTVPFLDLNMTAVGKEQYWFSELDWFGQTRCC